MCPEPPVEQLKVRAALSCTAPLDIHMADSIGGLDTGATAAARLFIVQTTPSSISTVRTQIIC